MSDTHMEISDYADELISVPRARLRLTLSQTEESVTLAHEGRMLVRCEISAEGMMASGFMAQALGVDIPAIDTSVEVRVSTGVLFRALGIVSLDFSNEASLALLERMLEEAQMQRRG